MTKQKIVAIFKSILNLNKLALTSEQVEMLIMAELKIDADKRISEEDVLKFDAEWLD